MNVVVCGLLMKLFIEELSSAEQGVLLGPAAFAALGVQLAGESAILHAMLPWDFALTDSPIRKWCVQNPHVEVSPLPALIWRSKRLWAEDRSARVDGNPGLWFPGVSHRPETADLLVLANGDPEWYFPHLVRQLPSFLAIDLHGEWIALRRAAILELVRIANLVTVAETDWTLLAKGGGARIESARGKAVLCLKRGARGVVLQHGDRSLELPPPVAPGLVKHDVGAGDLLLGLLATRVSQFVIRGGKLDLEDVARAYQEIAPFVGAFLRASGPAGFAREHAH